MSEDANLNSKSGRRIVLMLLALVVLVAAAVRWARFPDRYEMRDSDEPTYLQSSLQLLESWTPGNKQSPAGPQIWLGWAYGMARVAGETVAPPPELKGLPLQIRPLAALDHVCFDLSRDLSPLRRFELILFCVLGVLAAAAAFGLGHHHAGWAGGLLAGMLAAACPLFVDQVTVSKPYGIAWALGLMALYCADGATPRRQRWAAIFLGLAIGARIEMLTLVPILGWQIWNTRSGQTFRRILRLLGVAAMVALLVAPWWMMHLIGNLRAIATIRLADAPGAARVTAWQSIREQIWVNAMIIPLALTALLLAMRGPAGRARGLVLAGITLALFATTLRGGFGLHQNGAVLLVEIVAGAVGLAALQARWRCAATAVAIVGAVLVTVQIGLHIGSNRGRAIDDPVCAWIEQNIPAGTRVYYPLSLRNILPTPAASQRIWSDAFQFDLYQRKLKAGMARFGLSAEALPRALSEDNLIGERANRRKWFLLGNTAYEPNTPRYDVRHQSYTVLHTPEEQVAEFEKQGGVFIWPVAFNGEPPPSWGTPTITWTRPGAPAVHVYTRKVAVK